MKKIKVKLTEPQARAILIECQCCSSGPDFNNAKVAIRHALVKADEKR